MTVEGLDWNDFLAVFVRRRRAFLQIAWNASTLWKWFFVSPGLQNGPQLDTPNLWGWQWHLWLPFAIAKVLLGATGHLQQSTAVGGISSYLASFL